MMLKLQERFETDFFVSDDIYSGFIDLFRDKNPLHTDGDFARNQGFKDCVMHGNILNGFLSYFVGECLPMKNVIIHSQEIQFRKPVYLHDRLHLLATVVGVYDSVNAVEIKFNFTNQQATSVATGKIQIGVLS